MAEYREDFSGAADSQRKTIDLKLYDNDRDRLGKLLLEIDALRARSKNTKEN